MQLNTQKHEYKPALICRLLGHKFEFRTQKPIKLEDGAPCMEGTTHMFNFCRRCGVFNPNILGEDTLRAVLRKELGL